VGAPKFFQPTNQTIGPMSIILFCFQLDVSLQESGNYLDI
jgi:hypothetical protein